jgi:hypothetical protein
MGGVVADGDTRCVDHAPGMETCTLYETVGLREPCPGKLCAFWESGACVIKQLATPTEGRPDIAAWLLDLRQTLEAQRPGFEPDASAFHRSLSKGKE